MTSNGQTAATADTATEARARSTIEFPYFDLASAIEVAQAVKAIGGTGADMKSVAVKLNMAPDGGGFRTRIMAAKTFGVLDYERGHVRLMPVGLRIVDPQFERAAKLEAFMAVPLYKAMFDRLNGQTLPPPPALDRMAESMGVAPKQADKARQAFMRSAKTAGLFELAIDRLALPPNVQRPAVHPPKDEKPPEKPKGGGGDGGGHHPFIEGLLDKLPAPESEWPVEARAKWLLTAANIFDLMYVDPTTGKTVIVEVKPTGGSS